MTLALDANQISALCKIVCSSDCTEADIRVALSLYPGDLTPNDCISASTPVGRQIADCAKATFGEAPYLSSSFVLRLVEQNWAKDVVQSGVLAQVPILLRPPRVLDAQIAAVKLGVEALLQSIPPGACQADLGDVDAFRRVCTMRDQIGDVVAALERFAALKALHDALHLLQVLGTRWLDPIPAPATTASAPLPTLLDMVKTIAAHPADELLHEYAETCARCLQTTLDAERRLATGDPDERDYAHAALRSMLVQELPLLDAAMFAVSRQFPLRSFRAIFPHSVAREAAIDLYDTIRRRLMEHSEWQRIDLRLYAVEQSLVTTTGSLIGQLARGPLPLALFSLRVLLGDENAARVTAPMRDAVTRYSMSTDPDKLATDGITGSVGEIRTAFVALRDAARSAFLETDQALKHDFGSLLVLQPALRGLLARVPEICMLWLPLEPAA